MNAVLNISLVIIGIVVMTVFPPLGLLIVVLAGVSADSRRKKRKRYTQALDRKRAIKQERARILAFKSL